ncbi:HHE domain-containing protein [Crassisporium funariophilum]|nr:HHE domain-containing protein [Crassisporium funariophilum]
MFARPLARTSLALLRPTTTATANLKFRTMATTSTSSTHGPLHKTIADDHQDMYAYYKQYLNNEGDAAEQDKWARQLTWTIARHAIGEELSVYPLFEKHLGAQGKKMAEEDRAEHQYVKEQLYKLEKVNAGTPEHAATLKDAMDHLKQHNEGEEGHDLPALEKAMSASDSADAAATFERTKDFAPTRSHPDAPNRPPFETLAGLMAAPMDKLKDAFSKFPSAEEKSAAKKQN